MTCQFLGFLHIKKPKKKLQNVSKNTLYSPYKILYYENFVHPIFELPKPCTLVKYEKYSQNIYIQIMESSV